MRFARAKFRTRLPNTLAATFAVAAGVLLISLPQTAATWVFYSNNPGATAVTASPTTWHSGTSSMTWPVPPTVSTSTGTAGFSMMAYVHLFSVGTGKAGTNTTNAGFSWKLAISQFCGPHCTFTSFTAIVNWTVDWAISEVQSCTGNEFATIGVGTTVGGAAGSGYAPVASLSRSAPGTYNDNANASVESVFVFTPIPGVTSVTFSTYLVSEAFAHCSAGVGSSSLTDVDLAGYFFPWTSATLNWASITP